MGRSAPLPANVKRRKMAEFPPSSYSEAELTTEFDRLFQEGFAGPDVLQELAPAGWERSPLLAVFHPSLEQVQEEMLRLHGNLTELRKPDERRPLPPAPSFEEIARS